MNYFMMNGTDTGLDVKKSYVKKRGCFTLADKKKLAPISYSAKDFKGILYAIHAFAGDVKLVTDREPEITKKLEGDELILIGTIGKNANIDRLIKEQKLSVTEIQGRRETFIMETVKEPFEGVKKALVIAGSDKRGTIYGIYKLSEIIGVSAWVWFADSLPDKQDVIKIADGKIVSKEPSVEYRGIFINDENPCFGDWCNAKFGGVNSKMYVHVFELILRLKGNFMWPAMWGKSINIDDPESPRLADEMGVVLGTSHHEPMMRAQKEWTVLGDEFGGHANWNYQTNKEGLYRFWEERIKENKDYEKLITVGMRGDGDEEMIANGTLEENINRLEEIVQDQREIIAKHINSDVTKVPQVWCIYKEVENFYHNGLKIPDDITLMLCDDNFGNLRTIPTKEERMHKGGFGMYYHFDYVGGPFSYKWINNMPLQKTWEQMTMAYDYGIRKIWIVNVGDLKPMEFPISYFLDLAYDMEKWGKPNRVEEYTYEWAKKEFGESYASEIATILRTYTKINGICKPENLREDTFSLVNYNEADRILAEYEKVAKKAEELKTKMPEHKQDAFYQLVYYPTVASYLMYRLHINVAKNHVYSKQHRNSTNQYARIANECFVKDALMSEYYNKVMSGGKWDHMMTQPHIGQYSWRSAEVNIMPQLYEAVPSYGGPKLFVAVPDQEELFIEGSVDLPEFINIIDETCRITVGNTGDSEFEYTVNSKDAFITFKRADDKKFVTGSLTSDTYEDSYIDVKIDWSKIPEAKKQVSGKIVIAGAKREVTILVHAKVVNVKNIKSKTFVEAQGVISMEAEHYAKNVANAGAQWKVIKDYGRTLSSMKVFPTVLEPRTPKTDAPYLEYQFVTDKSGTFTVTTILAPTNYLSKDTGMKLAIQIDEETPVIVDSFSNQNAVGSGKKWGEGVMVNAHLTTTTHQVKEKKEHTLRIYMVDAGLTLQKIVIDCGQYVKESYLGPVESYYVK